MPKFFENKAALGRSYNEEPELFINSGVGTESSRKNLGRPKLRWEDVVQRDVDEELGGRLNWKDYAMNKDGWRISCETGWS